jgi:proline racemase
MTEDHTAGGAIKPNTFFCLDGHTCGNPVRLVAGAAARRWRARP